MRIYYVLLAVLIFFLKAEAVLINPPENKATKVHQQTYLNCSSDSSSYPAWQFGIPGSVITIVSGSCDVDGSYTTKYRSESTGTFSCNLIILSPTFDEAGIYTCIDSSDFTQVFATLTVLNATGTPTISNSSDVVEGEVLTFTCTVLYNTSTVTTVSSPIPPILFWTDPNGINITDASSITNTSNSVTSLFDITATIENILSYKCTAYFNSPPSGLPPTVASNAPSDTFFWETYQIHDILYPPSQPNITETPANFSECEASNLICASDSNPSPSFQWIDLTHGIVTNGQLQILAEYGSIFTCTAINTIRGIPYKNSANYSASSPTDNSCRFPYPTNINISNEDCADDDICVYNCPDVLTCYVDTYPPASYVWIRSNSVHVFNQTIRVYENGNYTCQVSVYIDGLNLKANKTIEVNNCNKGNVETHGLSDAEIAGIVVGCVATANILMTIVFLIIYTKNKDDYNETFSFLEKMLPFWNNSKDHLMFQILWTILSILIAVSIGIIILPVIMIKVTFCK